MIPNPFSGKFVVFEGIDGSGKSTQLKKAYDWIYGLGMAVIVTKEPDKNGPWGSRIYQELKKSDGLHKTNPHGFQAWYACDSKLNLRNNIIPHLKAGCHVLSDRFRQSLCYGAKDPPEFPALMEMNCQIIGEDFIWPDLILIFDVSINTAIDRLKKKGRNMDSFENVENLRLVKFNYQVFAKHYPNCRLVNAGSSEEVVFEEVKKHLQQILGLKGELECKS